MRSTSPSWPRVAFALALIGVLSAATFLSPATAGSGVSKKFVRKLVNNRVGRLQARLDQTFEASRTTAISRQLVGPYSLPGSAQDNAVATLTIPSAGRFLVTAKLWWTVVNGTSTGVGGEIDCDLLAGSAFDTSRESGVTDFDYGTLNLQLAHDFPGATLVTLRCRDEFQGGNPVEVHNVVVTAMEVFALDNAQVGRAAPMEQVPAIQRP